MSAGDEHGCEHSSRSARSAGSEAAGAHYDRRGYRIFVPHGVYSRYTHGGCRCDECREANRIACYLRRTGLGPGRRKRGHNVSGYLKGCRCDVCRADKAYWARRLYHSRKLRATTDAVVVSI